MLKLLKREFNGGRLYKKNFLSLECNLKCSERKPITFPPKKFKTRPTIAYEYFSRRPHNRKMSEQTTIFYIRSTSGIRHKLRMKIFVNSRRRVDNPCWWCFVTYYGNNKKYGQQFGGRTKMKQTLECVLLLDSILIYCAKMMHEREYLLEKWCSMNTVMCCLKKKMRNSIFLQDITLNISVQKRQYNLSLSNNS